MQPLRTGYHFVKTGSEIQSWPLKRNSQFERSKTTSVEPRGNNGTLKCRSDSKQPLTSWATAQKEMQRGSSALPKRKGWKASSPSAKTVFIGQVSELRDWPNFKARLQQEFVIGGFTAPKGSRKYLGALVIGAYTDGKLRHYGYVGSGFSEKGLKDAINRMKPYFTDNSLFVNSPSIKEKIQWVKPKLVCEIEYAELTLMTNFARPPLWDGGMTRSPAEVVLEF